MAKTPVCVALTLYCMARAAFCLAQTAFCVAQTALCVAQTRQNPGGCYWMMAQASRNLRKNINALPVPLLRQVGLWGPIFWCVFQACFFNDCLMIFWYVFDALSHSFVYENIVGFLLVFAKDFSSDFDSPDPWKWAPGVSETLIFTKSPVSFRIVFSM